MKLREVKKKKIYVGKWSTEEIKYSCRKQQIEVTNTQHL